MKETNKKRLAEAKRIQETCLFPYWGLNAEKAIMLGVYDIALNFFRSYQTLNAETLEDEITAIFGNGKRRAKKKPENGTVAGSGYTYIPYLPEEIELSNGFVLNAKEKSLMREVDGFSVFPYANKYESILNFCESVGYTLFSQSFILGSL